MAPTNPTLSRDCLSVEKAEQAIRQLITAHHEWFVAENGGAPLSINADEFDFLVAHHRLLFSSWTESGSRTWRVPARNSNGSKLPLRTSRRTGAQFPVTEL